jgi:hypothetical protein
VFAVVAWAVSGRNFTNQTGTQMSPGADQHWDTAGPRVLTGTMDDWIGAVCFAGLVAYGGTGCFLPGAADGRNCASAHAGRDASVPNPEAVNRFPIFIGAYGSPSARANDLKPRLAGAARIGPYAEGVDSASGEIVVFALRADATPAGDPLAPLRPLMPYRFALHDASPAQAPTPRSEPCTP